MRAEDFIKGLELIEELALSDKDYEYYRKHFSSPSVKDRLLCMIASRILKGGSMSHRRFCPMRPHIAELYSIYFPAYAFLQAGDHWDCSDYPPFSWPTSRTKTLRLALSEEIRSQYTDRYSLFMLDYAVAQLARNPEYFPPCSFGYILSKIYNLQITSEVYDCVQKFIPPKDIASYYLVSNFNAFFWQLQVAGLAYMSTTGQNPPWEEKTE